MSDLPIDVAAHNAVMTLTNLYGRLLQEKQSQIDLLMQRLAMAGQEVNMLRKKLEVVTSEHAQKDGQGMAGGERVGEAAQQGRLDEGGGGRAPQGGREVQEDGQGAAENKQVGGGALEEEVNEVVSEMAKTIPDVPRLKRNKSW